MEEGEGYIDGDYVQEPDEEPQEQKNSLGKRYIFTVLTTANGFTMGFIIAALLFVFSFNSSLSGSAVDSPPLNGLPAYYVPKREVTAIENIGYVVSALLIVALLATMGNCYLLLSKDKPKKVQELYVPPSKDVTSRGPPPVPIARGPAENYGLLSKPLYPTRPVQN